MKVKIIGSGYGRRYGKVYEVVENHDVWLRLAEPNGAKFIALKIDCEFPYVNTKENSVNFSGRVWITPRERKGKNICLDIGKTELKVIAFVPEVTENVVRECIRAYGYDPDEWM